MPHSVVSDLALQCMLTHVCDNIWGKCGKVSLRLNTLVKIFSRRFEIFFPENRDLTFHANYLQWPSVSAVSTVVLWMYDCYSGIKLAKTKRTNKKKSQERKMQACNHEYNY